MRLPQEVAQEEPPKSKLPRWKTSTPEKMEMEKRKAKPPSPLMAIRLGKILEGITQAPKRGRYLYNDEVKK